jgi:tetratricopeptide (TPR) repeat protein
MRIRDLIIFFVKLTISLVTVLLITNFSYCQNQYNSSTVNKIKKSAKELFRINEFKNAIPLYIILDSIMPNENEYSYKLGICYLSTNLKNKSLKPLLKSLNDPNIPIEKFFYVGRAYHLGHEFEKAIESYQKYISLKSLQKNSNQDVKQTQRLIEMCKTGIELMLSPKNVTVQNLGPQINSPYDDIAPLISIDESLLIFTSKRVINPDENSYDYSEANYENIYYSNKVDGVWQAAQSIGAPINTINHDAAVGLSPDGQKLFVYRASRNTSLTHRASGDLFLSKKENENWLEPEYIQGEINSKAWEPSASITENEQMLFFTSDRDGGFGGRDIYMAKKLPNGDWAKPKNLGNVINTPYDEDGPYIHPEGTKLYFSSKGHNTMGGFDIFKSEYNSQTDTWSKPENLGFPFNTADDDIYFVWSKDERRAYFSSAREDSYGETDIYMIYKEDDQNAAVVVEGGIYNTENHLPVMGSVVVREATSNSIIGIYETDPETTKYTMILKSGKSYVLEINLESYKESSINLTIDKTDEFYKMNKNIYIEKVKEMQFPAMGK